MSLPDWKTMPSDERDRLLTDLCAEGLSCSEIAVRFQNSSRCSVAGRISRLQKAGAKLRLVKMPGWNQSGQPKGKRAAARAKKAAGQPAPKPKLVAPPAKQMPTRPIEVAAPPPVHINPANLFHRTGCTWVLPVLDPDGFPLYCNQPTDGSWCAHHRAIGYVPPSERRRAA